MMINPSKWALSVMWNDVSSTKGLEMVILATKDGTDVGGTVIGHGSMWSIYDRETKKLTEDVRSEDVYSATTVRV